jgi:hypothetical protein
MVVRFFGTMLGSNKQGEGRSGSVSLDGSGIGLSKSKQMQLATAIAVARHHIAIDLAIKNTSVMP